MALKLPNIGVITPKYTPFPDLHKAGFVTKGLPTTLILLLHSSHAMN